MSSHTRTAGTTVRSSIVVEALIDHAFRVFTEDFGEFKPLEHNLLAVEIAETPERTRIQLEHRYLDRHADGWESLSAGVAGDAGWPLCLQRSAALFEQVS